jgi:hypothetical protein
MTPAEQFEEACRRHDLSFQHADDYAAWRAGNESLHAINRMADELGIEVAAPIWNRVVDTKLLPHARAEYYWTAPAKSEAA